MLDIVEDTASVPVFVGPYTKVKFKHNGRFMELKDMTQDAVDKYRRSVGEIERKANMSVCGCCGCRHPVRLHMGDDLRITPIYRGCRPCDGYMRVLMSEIRALQRRTGLPENIC